MMSEQPWILVTGATDGIGRETALALAKKGARVIVHGRSAEKVARVVEEVRAAGSPTVHGLRADFARLDEVREMARELDELGISLDVLLNNAGIFARKHERTVDGFESTMAVNHLAPLLLTHLVLDGTAGRRLSRIVNVSSMAHASGRVDAGDPGGKKSTVAPSAAYSASKLANILFTVELARRLSSRPTINALHPGVVSTKLLKTGWGMEGPDTLAEGARTSVLLALSPTVADVTGGYFVDQKQVRTNRVDPAVASRFYVSSCEAVGVEPRLDGTS